MVNYWRMRVLSSSSILWALAAGSVLQFEFGASKCLAQEAEPEDAAPTSDARSLLEKGFRLYQEGDYALAIVAFESAFALSPSDDTIRDFVEKTKVASILAMIRDKKPSKHSKLAGIGQQLLQAARTSIAAKVEDEKRVEAAVKEVIASEGQDRLVLRIKHTGAFGRNLVPALIPFLAASELSRRAVAIGWVLDIGLDAVPILQAARKHPNSMVRTNVAYLLGRVPLRHAVSLATLQAMVETDEMQEVKEAARSSFKTILAGLNGGGQGRQAKEYFLANAEEYYLRPHHNPFAKGYYSARIYRLEGERIVGEVVADFQFSERMAKQALEEALELDPSYEPARVLTVCNDCALIAEYDLNVDYYSKNENQPEIKALLESQKPYIDYVLRLRLLSAPPPVLFGGLARSLEDQRPEVARLIVETIHATRRGKAGVPGSLGKALQDQGSRLVRVASAIAIAYANPPSRLEEGDAVVSTLCEAILTSGIRTVQRVMGDSRRANRFGEILTKELNMETYSPLQTVEQAYNEVVNFPPDMILLDENVRTTVGNKEVGAVNHFVTLLRRNYRTANVPIVIAVAPEQVSKAEELYQSKERKVWVVPDTVDGQGMKGLLEKLFENTDDAKMQATRLATAAAEAIEYVSSVHTALPVRSGIRALLEVLHNRPDSVRIPCIRALGNLKAGEAAEALATQFGNANNATEVRVAAMMALGQALEANGASPTVLRTIQEGMQESKLELRRAAWYAFSNSGVSPEVHFQVALKAQPPSSTGGALVPEQPAGAPVEGAETPEEEAEEAPEPDGAETDDADAGDAGDAGAGDSSEGETGAGEESGVEEGE